MITALFQLCGIFLLTRQLVNNLAMCLYSWNPPSLIISITTPSSPGALFSSFALQLDTLLRRARLALSPLVRLVSWAYLLYYYTTFYRILHISQRFFLYLLLYYHPYFEWLPLRTCPALL